VHEAAIAIAILRRAAEALSRQFETEIGKAGLGTNDGITEHTDELPKVSSIQVNVGEFRNVDPESLDFAFQSLRKDFKYAEDARLKINRIDAIAKCTSGHTYSPKPDKYYACTTCGAGIDKLVNGEELEIKSFELLEAKSELKGGASRA